MRADASLSVQVRAGFRLGLVPARIAENPRLSSRLVTSLMTSRTAELRSFARRDQP
jgi:hypothetical protein